MFESLTGFDIALVLAIGFMVGLAKAGIHGLTLLSVPLLALLFGGKHSSGVMLPMLIMADIFAVHHYHRHANWQFLIKLFPSAIVGVLIGTWLGEHINDALFMQIMSVIIFASVGLMLWLERNKSAVPDYTWFAILAGVLGGFTTMVGNLAGSVMAVYLLSMRLPKNAFIGTAAWFFLVINIFKVPFHVYVWETINWQSFTLNLIALPLIIAGVYLGIWLVKRINEKHYRWLVIGMTLLAAAALLPGQLFIRWHRLIKPACIVEYVCLCFYVKAAAMLEEKPIERALPMSHCFPTSARHGLFLSVLAALLLGCNPSPTRNEDSVSASQEQPQPQVAPAGKPVVYQVFTRLFGNKNTTNKPWGTLEENGVGKFADFTNEALQGIKELGTTHIWYTGVPHHAVINDYSAYGISHDDPDVVKGRAGSPYAVKDYYNVNPDLAVDPANRLAEFEALIARTHAHGMKVIIDIVPNHVARNYESLSSPAGVSDFGAHDNTAVTYALDNNFYYVVGESFQVPAADNGYQPLGGQPHPLADGKFEENPAKWTGNGARAARPDANDWYETVKVNYGIKPDGSEDFPALPAGFEQQSVTAHAAFWLDKDVPDSWRKFRDITHYWLDKGVDGFRYDMAEMVPVAFWSYLNSSIKVRNPNAFLLAEVYQPHLYRDYLQLGKMDYLYDKVAFYDSLKAIMQGHGDTADLVSIQADIQDIERHMLHFLENHDEQRIAAPAFAGDADKGKPAMVVSALISRSPTMLYFGQEVGEDGSEDMGFGKPSRTTIFDYAGVPAHQRWMNNGAFDGGQLTEKERALRDFYRRVLNISADYPAMRGDYYSLHAASLANDSDYSSSQLAFARWTDTQHMIVAANFNATTPVTIELTLPKDLLLKWQLPQGEVALTEHLNRPQTTNKMMVNGETGRIQLTLPPLGSVVYTIDR